MSSVGCSIASIVLYVEAYLKKACTAIITFQRHQCFGVLAAVLILLQLCAVFVHGSPHMICCAHGVAKHLQHRVQQQQQQCAIGL
jgi:hypothetical protein